MSKYLNRGISTPIVIGIIAVLVVVVGGGILSYKYLSPQKNNNQLQNQQQTPNNQTNNNQSSITVISPNGGETWKPGETHDITWQSSGVDNVVIWLAKKGASDVAEIITGSSNVPASLGKYTWAIPTNNNDINLGGEFKITVGNAALPNQYVRDTSDNYFSIIAPVVDQTAGWKTYANTQYGYTIKYPSDWIGAEQTLTMSNLGQLVYFKTSNLSVSVWNTSTYSYDQLKIPGPEADQNTIKQENLIINGYPAVKFSYTSPGDANSGATSKQKVSILKNQQAYMIECGGQECTKIISTFKFTK